MNAWLQIGSSILLFGGRLGAISGVHCAKGRRFFGMNNSKAAEIMFAVHKNGLAVVGVFAFEIAETKVAQVMDCASQNQHPLQCTMEKE